MPEAIGGEDAIVYWRCSETPASRHRRIGASWLRAYNRSQKLTRESMRASGDTTQLQRGQGPQSRDCGTAGARALRPTAPSWSSCRRSSTCSARPRTCARAPSRSRARPPTGPAALCRELGRVAGRRQHRRARRGRRQAAQHVRAGRPGRRDRTPPTARSTCSTSRSAASMYRESDAEAPGDEVVRRRRRRRCRSGMAVCYDLRFPELFRIMAVRGARAIVAAGGLHASHRPRALGDPRARARDREPGLHDRGGPDRKASARPRELRPLDDRRPVGIGARRGARTRSASSPPTSTSMRRREVREKLPSLANRRPGRPTAGRRLLEAAHA